jgi:dephospho-CoA kinase
MLKLGITGGIGSGKTTICNIFGSLGIPVFYADEKAKLLIESDEELKRAIIKEFGPESFGQSGYNRKYIASLVFRDHEALLKLNCMIHPKVADDFTHWVSQQESCYVIFEAAVLFESGACSMVDFSIVIDAPIQLRIERVMKRDVVTKEEIEFRIKNQWPTDEIKKMADWVIMNDDKTLILPEVLKIHNHLISLHNSYG